MTKWPEEHKQILRSIFASDKTVKELAHLLPMYSVEGIYRKGLKMGLVKRSESTVLERITDLMSDGRARTTAEVMAATNAKKSFVGDILQKLVRKGEMHISEYAGSRTSPVFKLGAGQNAERPPAKTQAEYRAGYRAGCSAVRTAAPRDEDVSPASWWPWADPVVVASINAMVHAGRSA
jgi:hypothetical protein